MDKYVVIDKEEYKKGWKVDLKKDFVVIKQKGNGSNIPQKTFTSVAEANAWIKTKGDNSPKDNQDEYNAARDTMYDIMKKYGQN